MLLLVLVEVEEEGTRQAQVEGCAGNTHVQVCSTLGRGADLAGLTLLVVMNCPKLPGHGSVWKVLVSCRRPQQHRWASQCSS